MSDKWETVGKSKKNRNEGNKKITKQQKKKFVDNMPKLDEAKPIKESVTMFDLFIEKEFKKAQQQGDNKSNGVPKSNKEGGSQGQKKKNPDKKKTQPPPKLSSVEDVIAALGVGEMENHLSVVCARFPGSPMVWSQDLATYLNLKLDVETPDPVFSSKPIGYPSTLLSPAIRKLIFDTMQCCGNLQLLYEFCFMSMIQDSLKGFNTLGYRIFLQILTRESPNLAISHIPKCIEFRNSYQNRQQICLSILWAIGQAGNTCLETGLRVWIEVMFPILGTRAYSSYVTEYIEQLLNCHKHLKLENNVFGVRDLFPVLDNVFSSSGLSAKYQKQLQAIYPKLKVLSYEPNPSTVLRNYFPSYLTRLQPNCTAAMRKELLMSLVECLAIDKHTYSIWRQLYIKHFSHSRFLIEHLCEEWHNLPKTFPRKLLHETLSTFQVTNDELKGQGKQSQDVEAATVACSALMTKMNSHHFPWRKLLLFLTVVITAVLAYDVQQHGSFKRSKTAELLKDAGVLAICEQAYGKITVYSKKAYSWMEVNVPKYCLWMQETFGPYLRLFWEKLFVAWTYLWDSTQGIRTWANTNIPPLLQSISDNFPKYKKIVMAYVEEFVQCTINGLVAVWQFMGHYAALTISWLHQNVFTGSLSAENLQRYAGDTVQAFQNYTVTTYNWITKCVATIIYPGK